MWQDGSRDRRVPPHTQLFPWDLFPKPLESDCRVPYPSMAETAFCFLRLKESYL